MRKFKVVMITSYFDRNGVTSQVINYATNLDKNKFQVAIAAGEPYDIGYEKACQENNIELCKLPQKQKNAYSEMPLFAISLLNAFNLSCIILLCLFKFKKFCI